MSLFDLVDEAKKVLDPPCQHGNHEWRHIGGCNCGCHDGNHGCSVPVYECVLCGDCDYGENEEATALREKCAEARECLYAA